MPRVGNSYHEPLAHAVMMDKLAKPPKPPFALTRDQQTVWDMIVATRAPEEWSGIDEFLAADLCIVTIALRDARLRLLDEDLVISGPRGGSMVNPLMAIVSSLVNQELRLAARLRLSVLDAGVQDNTTTAGARKRKISEETRQQISGDDTLISRPLLKPVQ